MNLLHVIRTMDPAWGGPVEGVSNFTYQARLRGHHAEVVCVDPPTSPWLKRSLVPVNAVGRGRLGHFGYNRRLDEWLDANLRRFDAVIVNGIWMYFSSAARRSALKAGLPYFVFTHGALDPWFAKHYPHKQVKKAAYWFLYESKVMRDAEAVLFTTREEKEVSHNAFWPYRCNAQVTGYGIQDPLPALELENSGNEARQMIEQIVPGVRGRKYILFLARVHEKKGIDLLLRAIANTRVEGHEYRFMIAGPGEPSYVAELKALAAKLGVSERVMWTGPLYAAQKWAAVRSADAYILPSHQENFGISVAEALACGVPVMITDRVNIWREIQAAGGGMIETDDVAGTTRMLQRWFAMQPEERQQMREQSRACFKEHFDIAKVSDQFFDLVQASVNARRQGVACAY